jgi:hypothetical protein
MTRTKPRRWIAAEIEGLDPATDYEEIWRLTSSYGLNDFALNLVYAHLFPHFILPPHGSVPLWDNGRGKVVEHASQRLEDTIRNNLLWWYYGLDTAPELLEDPQRPRPRAGRPEDPAACDGTNDPARPACRTRPGDDVLRSADGDEQGAASRTQPPDPAVRRGVLRLLPRPPSPPAPPGPSSGRFRRRAAHRGLLRRCPCRCRCRPGAVSVS